MRVFEIMAIMWSGAAMVWLGVVLGGFLVFRAKRPGEYILPPKEYILPPKETPVAGPVNVDGLLDLSDDEPEEEVTSPLDVVAMEQNAKFLAQLAKDKSEALDNE